MMSTYSYIGDYWYNPGGSGLGGCYYFDSIKEYLSASRLPTVQNACNGPDCGKGGSGTCTKTTTEDQEAYTKYQVNKNMGPDRYNIFGL